MKILDVTIKRKVNCSLNICKWNHLDGDHLNYVHKQYKDSQIFYEDDRVALYFHQVKIPFIPFLNINTVDVTVLKDKNTVLTYGFQFGIPSLTTVVYKEIGKDRCSVNMNYKFKLTGLWVLFYPILKILIPAWNKRTWNEDLPLKLRRQKVKRLNFKDFKGLSNEIKNRDFTGEIDFKLPIKKLKKTGDHLTEHPFYNLGKKDDHI